MNALRLRNERGVAMVTVLFVGAVLTAVGSTAALLAIGEFRAGRDDRKASEALGFAEAGIERLVLEIKRGSYTWGDIREAGCERPVLALPEGVLGKGTFEATLTVFDPYALDSASRFPPAACAARGDETESQFFAITSTGEHPAARRLVRQVVKVGPSKLAYGLYADRIDANGNAGMIGVSVLTQGDFTGRDKVGFTGLDPYYTLGDFYPGMSTSTPIPAAAHATGSIYFQSGGKNKQEHPPSPNCSANPRGAAGQSLWDGSGAGGPVSVGCPGQMGIPPTSLFTENDMARVAPNDELSEQDYLTLKESAKSSGIYCSYGASGGSCTVAGSSRSAPSVVQDGDIAGVGNNFVAYFDFPSDGDPFSGSNTVKWKAAVGPCSDVPGQNRSVTLVVRNGSLHVNSGALLTGAILVPEGAFDSNGSFETHGTVISREMRIRGGATFRLSECWVRNVPGPLLDVTPVHWSELDR